MANQQFDIKSLMSGSTAAQTVVTVQPSITPEQNAKIKEWMKKYEGQHFGAIGGAFTYRFTPTGIGTFATVTGPDGDELKFQEAD